MSYINTGMQHAFLPPNVSSPSFGRSPACREAPHDNPTLPDIAHRPPARSLYPWPHPSLRRVLPVQNSLHWKCPFSISPPVDMANEEHRGVFGKKAHMQGTARKLLAESPRLFKGAVSRFLIRHMSSLEGLCHGTLEFSIRLGSHRRVPSMPGPRLGERPPAKPQLHSSAHRKQACHDARCKSQSYQIPSGRSGHGPNL